MPEDTSGRGVRAVRGKPFRDVAAAAVAAA
jgi:hypothetical protein